MISAADRQMGISHQFRTLTLDPVNHASTLSFSASLSLASVHSINNDPGACSETARCVCPITSACLSSLSSLHISNTFNPSTTALV